MWTRDGAIESWDDGKTEVLSKSGSFPALTSLPDGGVLAAWEEGGAIKTRRIIAGSARAPAASARRGTYGRWLAGRWARTPESRPAGEGYESTPRCRYPGPPCRRRSPVSP